MLCRVRPSELLPAGQQRRAESRIEDGELALRSTLAASAVSSTLSRGRLAGFIAAGDATGVFFSSALSQTHVEPSKRPCCLLVALPSPPPLGDHFRDALFNERLSFSESSTAMLLVLTMKPSTQTNCGSVRRSK